MNLEQRFSEAQQQVKQLSSRPSDDDLLSLYAWFKQATEGDNETRAPGMFEFRARIKYDAWLKVSGTSTEAAMEAYIAKVEALQNSEVTT